MVASLTRTSQECREALKKVPANDLILKRNYPVVIVEYNTYKIAGTANSLAEAMNMMPVMPYKEYFAAENPHFQGKTNGRSPI